MSSRSRLKNPPAGSARVGAVRLAACAAFSVAIAAAGGCMVGPRYVRPPIEPPASFKSPAPSGDQQVPEEWWRLYGDADLDRLIATANASNQTLRIAVARVDEARALARIAASYRYPTIAVSGIYTRQRTSANRVSTITGQPVASSATFNDWLVPVDLSYEVDVWGRVRRSL